MIVVVVVPFVCGVNVGDLLCGTSIASIESIESIKSIDSIECFNSIISKESIKSKQSCVHRIYKLLGQKLRPLYGSVYFVSVKYF